MALVVVTGDGVTGDGVSGAGVLGESGAGVTVTGDGVTGVTGAGVEGDGVADEGILGVGVHCEPEPPHFWGKKLRTSSVSVGNRRFANLMLPSTVGCVQSQ